MLVNLTNILKDAKENKYSVIAIDVTEDHLIRIILDTAQKMNSPIILNVSEHDLVGKGIDYITSMVKGVANRYTNPICLHLDHGSNFEIIKQAIVAGFTSVMFDGSTLPFEENIKRTKEIVEYAHQYNVTVEAELGHVGGKEYDVATELTLPEEAKLFVENTKVDALAVSIGTSHGIYKSLPELDINRLKEINDVAKVPLVLHGGSGTPEPQIKNAIANGICKINIFADIRIALRKGYELALTENEIIDPLPRDLKLSVEKTVSEIVKEKILLSGSNNKYQ